jgi:cardiolipin synthase
MLAAIAAARRRVSLEMYIFLPGRIGNQFAHALAAAARRGVAVRLVYDYIGCRDAPTSFFADLRQAGVHIVVYHAVRGWRPRFWSLFRRNHRKTLVLDGEIAFTGGLNIADEWLSYAEGGGDWRDAMIELRGPAVAELEAIFARTFNRRARKHFRLQPGDLSPPPAAGDSGVAVVANAELLDRFAIRRAAMHAIRAARERIFLANPYFVPDRGILRALRRAAMAGIDVRVLVPARSDFSFLDFAAQATFTPLMSSGVRIYKHEEVVHTKCLLVDHVFVSIGSYNLDHRSLAYNLETVVNTIDGNLAAAAAALFERELEDAAELRAELHALRPLAHRLIERIAYELRRWL